MSTPKSIRESLVDWQQMLDNLAPRLGELPHLRPLHDDLAALLAAATALETERSRQEARLREVNHERQLSHRQGRDLRNRLVAGLQGTFGPESEELIEFGIKPRPREVRRRRLSLEEKAERASQRAEAARVKAGVGEPAAASATKIKTTIVN